MSNASDWNEDEIDDHDELEDEIEGAFEDEDEDEQEYEDDGAYEDDEPDEGEDDASAGAVPSGGCLRTAVLAVVFWMVVALAAAGFCLVFGGRL